MKRPAQRQQTPKELLDALLGFVQRKFYTDDPIAFRKDRRRLLDWVILWPASWLNNRGVTVPADTYHQIFTSVFLDAKALGTDKIKYRPAWMKFVIQSHFKHHGEEIYDQAKTMRSVVEHTLLSVGRPSAAVPDPVRDLALARHVVAAPKATRKRPVKDQLTLL